MTRRIVCLLAALAGCGGGGGVARDAAAGGDAAPESSPGDAGGDVGGDGAGADALTFAGVAAALRSAIDVHPTSVDFTLMLGNAHGIFFEHSHGASTADTIYESASTSKWVTGAVLMHLVDSTAQLASPLALESRPQAFIASWTTDAADLRSLVTLEMLLSFRSGLQLLDNNFDCSTGLVTETSLASCVASIHAVAGQSASLLVPGQSFVYGSNHLQVAGLMAMRQQNLDTWGAVFEAFKADTGLFATSVYDLPDRDNPRLAGGMHWTAREYVAFLGRLFGGTLLSSASAQAMFSDHTPEGVVEMTRSPTLEGLGEMWHYGLGTWLECRSPTWQASCGSTRRFSSPGAYGAYPFIDFGAGFYGILARQGSLQSFPEGIQVYRDLEPLIDALVDLAP